MQQVVFPQNSTARVKLPTPELRTDNVLPSILEAHRMTEKDKMKLFIGTLGSNRAKVEMGISDIA